MKVLFLPGRMAPYHILRGILELLDITQTNNIYDQFDFAIFWVDLNGHSDRGRWGAHVAFDHLEKSGYWILNRHVKTTDKDFVEICHQRAFGYGMALEPITWDGPLIEKSIANATNDGTLLQGPLSADLIRTDKIYMKLINNITSDGLYRTQRTFIVDGQPTWVNTADTLPETRFQGYINRCRNRCPEDVYSQSEIEGIWRFCKLYGMDYGECDILRDVDEDRIYLLDANPTPGGYSRLFDPAENVFKFATEENHPDCIKMREDIMPMLVEPFQAMAMVERHVGQADVGAYVGLQEEAEIEEGRLDEDCSLTIGFVPGERFSLAAKALRQIIKNTHVSFELIIVDANIPEPYRTEIRAEVAGRNNVKTIESEAYLLPNEARNLVIKEAETEYICLIENDVLVEDRWLTHLLTALRAWPAQAAIPVVGFGREDLIVNQYSDHLHVIEKVETANGAQLTISPLRDLSKSAIGGRRAQVTLVHDRCILFRQDAVEQLGWFDEDLSWCTDLALSLKLYEHEMTAVLEPRCLVTHVPAYPPQAEELAYYNFRWHMGRAEASCRHIEKGRRLLDIDWKMNQVRSKQTIASMQHTKLDLSSLLPAGAKVALIDDGRWSGAAERVLAGYEVMPFPEKRGRFYGAPADDDAAIAELKRQQALGVTHLVFVKWSFWWLDYYHGFYDLLTRDYLCILRNARIIVFDIHRPGDRPSQNDIK